VALRRLRRFAREGSDLELDLGDTISSTARNAGYLDIKMVPERHNNVKVLMLLDVGGSMDDHISRVEELFRRPAANSGISRFTISITVPTNISGNQIDADRWSALRRGMSCVNSTPTGD